MKNSYIGRKHQIRLINGLYKMENDTLVKNKTIVLYEVYKNLKNQQDQIALNNLHTFAQLILQPKLNIVIQKQEDEVNEKALYRYHVKANDTSKKIKSTVFNVDEGEENGENSSNIVLYEKQDEDVRIVVIPIEADMIEITHLKEEADRDNQENIRVNKQMKDKSISGEQLIRQKQEWKIKQEIRQQERCKIAAQKHLKMFKIEAVLGTILQKTEKVSICSLVEIGERKFKTIEEFKAQFNRIFMVPEDFSPQFILYGYSQKKAAVVEEANKQGVTTIFQNNKGKFGIKKHEVMQEEHFYSNKNIRTKIYQKFQDNKNTAISTVKTDFVNTWSNIFIEAASSFEILVKKIGAFLPMKKEEPKNEEQKMEEGHDQSKIEEKQTKNQEQCLITYQQHFQNFMIDELSLPTKEQLGSFYDQNKSMKNIQKEGDEQRIPRAVEPLLFMHFFINIHHQWSQQLQKENKSDALTILPMWRNKIKLIFELIKEIQQTLLEQQYKELKCPDLQKFFNFITFAYDSLIKIQKITTKPLATHTSLRNKFLEFKYEKTSILNYILQNQDKIYPNQPIHYYAIYILIITQNCTPQLLKDLQFVFLNIHEKKAICIAKSYIHDLQKITEAIRSLALIGEKYHGLAQNKRKLIDIEKIQKIMSRLLKIIGQEEIAARICIKNRQYDLAHKSYQMAFVRLIDKNDDKAEKLISWGKLFQQGFQYDLAQHYYRRAFSCANAKSIKQMATQMKFQCLKDMRDGPTEQQMRVHDKFRNDGDVLSYTNDKDQLDKMISLFRKIRVCLSWQREAECSVLLDKSYDGEDANSSFYGIQNTQKKQQK